MLGRLGLLLAHRSHYRDQADVDEEDVLLPDPELELAQRLDERGALDVADGPAELDDARVGLLTLAIAGDVRHALDPLLYLVGDVRNHLHGLPEIIAPPFSTDHVVVDLPGGDVVIASQADI